MRRRRRRIDILTGTVMVVVRTINPIDNTVPCPLHPDYEDIVSNKVVLKKQKLYLVSF
jgi:hypothetical protein